MHRRPTMSELVVLINLLMLKFMKWYSWNMPGPLTELGFLEGDAVTVARQLLGWRFYRQEQAGPVGGIIVETEAYTQEDAASHSYKGRTPRTETMFGPAGYLYVYFTYGMHYCANIVTGQAGHGQGVLLRALIPDAGVEIMKQRRGGDKANEQLTNGPAKLCQALAIAKKDNGQLINSADFLLLPPDRPVHLLPASKRIGITRNADALWRFSAEI